MTWRYHLTLFLLISFLLLIVARLFYWQVIKAEELSELGKAQYGRFIKTIPKRGEIKASDGFPLAANKIEYLLFANPKEVRNKKDVSEVLSSKLSIEVASVSSFLSKDLFWVPVKSGINVKLKEEIEKLNLQGVGFEEQFSRFYPEASMAAKMLGFVGKNELGEDKGYYGLEGYYDRQLRGKATYTVQVHDAFGRPILAKRSDNLGGFNGRDVILNVDRPIQFMTERILKEGIEKYGASSGMVGIMDPKTGGILAMASFPSFDQREYREYSEDLYKNPFISNVYEPGSTFKFLVMAAGIDSKAVKPETKCTICSGPISIGGYEIKTWNNKYYENINMVDVIKHSDNTGMVFVAKSVGLERMLSYFRAFGIGELTEIDLQGEVSSNIKPENKWYPVDFATASFGQGISVTPIELLTAFSAIANGGSRMQPQVVSKIRPPDGQTIEIEPKVLNKPVSEQTAKVITEMLVNAVDKGEAKWAKPKGYRIAGKTGTAQIPIAGHYDPTKTIASFIGFAPADNPKFAMLVIIDRPTTSIYGAETAAPIFFDIAQNILSYYNISPSE